MTQIHLTFGIGELNHQAMLDIETNLTALFGFTEGNNILGACCGLKYLSLRRAIKKFGITEQYASSLYYVSKIINGTGSGTYTYTVEISKATSITGAGAVVVSHTYTVGTVKTGLFKFDLLQANGSGYTGDIEIDFDELVLGTTYTCANWSEGGLFAINTYANISSGGGGLATALPKQTGNFAPDGSLKEYIYTGTGGHTATVVAIADIVADVVIINASAYNLTLTSVGFNVGGASSISLTLASGGWIKIIADNTEFQVVGVGYTVVAP